jgi:prepilin-type processing-associated H-X9-DG protein
MRLDYLETGRRAGQRGAFTVLELLVVTSIIGVLIGLMLPALMAARESARRLQCTSNLHEIGLAVQQHHDAAKHLPQAWKSSADGLSGYGWAVALLPYLEERDLGSAVNVRLTVADARNDSLRSARVELMQCPSDISEPTFELHADSHGGMGDEDWLKSASEVERELADSASLVLLPAANYVGVFGTMEADDSFPAPAGDGPIVSHRRVRYADLERGQSHTLVIGERTTAMVPSTWLGVDFHGEDAACRLVGSAITTPSCETCDECEFGSRHSGGSNFAWADGHVSLVSDDIDPIEYQQLAKRF